MTNSEIEKHTREKLSWTKIKEFLKTPQGKKTIVIVLIALVILGIGGWAVYQRYFRHDKANSENKGLLPSVNFNKEEKEKEEICKLDGALHPISTSNRNPLAIMIENHPDARPQSGLDKASIIYEAIAEGGITRFMAIFGPQGTDKVGPVRSARTYYLDWALEYDAFYAHVGGNIDALDLIPSIGIKDLDQFKYGTQAYWRENTKGKATEHTMYTDTAKLWQIAQDNGWNMKADFSMLEFKEEATKDLRPESQEINIKFSTAGYDVTWNYDKSKNIYKRSITGSSHKDAVSQEQLTSKNIIIQEVKRAPTVTRINESGWDMVTTGEGKAKIFFDGKMIEGTWKKKNQDARTVFYDPDGNQIKFDPGVFWYEIVPQGTAVTVE